MGELIQRGRAWKFGDNICIDGQIMPLRFVIERETNPEVLAQFVMAGLDPEFPKKVKPGDFIVAGKRFAQGNPHAQGWRGMKALGLGVLSVWMPRGAYRTAVVSGVPSLPTCPDLTDFVSQADELEVNFTTGEARNLTTGHSRRYQPMPHFLLEIIEAGGSTAYLKRQFQTG